MLILLFEMKHVTQGKQRTSMKSKSVLHNNTLQIILLSKSVEIRFEASSNPITYFFTTKVCYWIYVMLSLFHRE